MISLSEMHVENSDSVAIKLVCNIHVWANFENLLVSGKNFTRNGLSSWAGHFLYQISDCNKRESVTWRSCSNDAKADILHCFRSTLKGCSTR